MKRITLLAVSIALLAVFGCHKNDDSTPVKENKVPIKENITSPKDSSVVAKDSSVAKKTSDASAIMKKPYKDLIFRQFWSADKYTTTFNWLVFRSASEVDYVITSFGKYGYDTIDVKLNYTADLSGQYPVYHITGDKNLPMSENPTFTNVDWLFTYTPAKGSNEATLNKGQLQYFYFKPRP